MATCDCPLKSIGLDVFSACPNKHKAYHLGYYNMTSITEKQRKEWVDFFKQSVISELVDFGFKEIQ